MFKVEIIFNIPFYGRKKLTIRREFLELYREMHHNANTNFKSGIL
jgi:hypothetical protein